MNLKCLNKKPQNVLDSEISRVKRAMSKISDSQSDKFKVLDSQYKALLRKKIRDTKQRLVDADLSEIKEKMLEDLKNNLQDGKVYYAYGADIPGEAVLYADKEQLIPAVKKYFIQDFQLPELRKVETLEDFKKILAKLGIENDLTDPFYKLSFVDETGEAKLLSGSNVEDLAPAMNFYSQIFLEGDPDSGEIRFMDDNDEFGYSKFVEL